MIDLTLNSFLHPNIIGLQPQFGTIITTDTQNKGGLSTAQVDNNMGMPFALMRPILVAQTDTTSEVEYDAKLLITGDQEVTITLGDAVYQGCTVQITHRGTQESYVQSIKINQNDVVHLTWFDSKWNRVNNVPALGHVYIQFRGEDAPADLYPGTTWENISTTYAGRFFRAEGGSAATFGSTQEGGLPQVKLVNSSYVRGQAIGLNSKQGVLQSQSAGYGASGGANAFTLTSFVGLNLSANEISGGVDLIAQNSLYGEANEVRPINETFRIWKRIG